MIHAPELPLSPADGLLIELRQCADEGRAVEPLRDRAAAILALPRGDARREWDAAQLYATLEQLPAAEDYGFCEPADEGTLRELRAAGPRRLPVKPDSVVLLDALHGAWLGRCAGCLLGKPLAGWKREQIVGFNYLAGNWPIADYMALNHPGEIVDEYELRKAAQRGVTRGWIEEIDAMPADDDLDFTLLALATLEAHGRAFTAQQAAQIWLARIPLLAAPAPERAALRNLAVGINPPLSATSRNPYREWTGARRAGALCGLVNPGWLECAASMARRFALISHSRNGIYDAMWVAAMLAAAFAERDVPTIIRLGLSELPFHSRLNLGVHDVLGWRGQGLSAEDAVQRLHDRWDESDPHDRAHAVCNAQAVAIALLWGEGDFEHSLGLAVGAGFDVDGNAATIGTLLGLLKGQAGITEKWTTPLRGRLRSNLAHQSESQIESLAQSTRNHALPSFREH